MTKNLTGGQYNKGGHNNVTQFTKRPPAPTPTKPITQNRTSETDTLGEPFSYKDIAHKLYDLLDDCDTADDLAKDNDKMYRNLVRRANRARFKYASTDGYDVVFNVPKDT